MGRTSTASPAVAASAGRSGLAATASESGALHRRRQLLRIGLVALAVPDAIVGAWLLFAPRSFYDNFPGFGHRWVGALGPYSEHPLTDFGGALLALALLTCLAALWMERRLVQAALLTVLLESVAHFVYHLTRLGALPTADDVANQLSLAYGIVLSLALLFLAQRIGWGTPTESAAENLGAASS